MEAVESPQQQHVSHAQKEKGIQSLDDFEGDVELNQLVIFNKNGLSSSESPSERDKDDQKSFNESQMMQSMQVDNFEKEEEIGFLTMRQIEKGKEKSRQEIKSSDLFDDGSLA